MKFPHAVTAALTMIPLLTACAAVPKKPLVDAAMKDPETRKDVVETVLRTLDEHPEYDDDVYQATKKHPKTFSRMIELASHDLRDKTFADSTTAIVAKDAAGTAEALVSAAEQVKKTPETNEAVNRKVSAHADLVVSLLNRDRPALDALLEAVLRAADKDEKARAVLLDVIQAAAPHILELVARDPKILSGVTEAILRAAMHDKAALKEMIKNIVGN
jgi:hypothetical protein